MKSFHPRWLFTSILAAVRARISRNEAVLVKPFFVLFISPTVWYGIIRYIWTHLLPFSCIRCGIFRIVVTIKDQIGPDGLILVRDKGCNTVRYIYDTSV